ncbi:YeeE/YedE family protein [Pseudobdellovibrio exovorus]|uniref:YeeE/YedE family protein n=1 Tax=Pseudobdellovibrio exovorus JSS TaxID=1184267 RepID=M4V7U5_9BACT|nr:YeeE/YedE family protein [Pseudobdellovibrio exovorus]AGH94490.1 hypothetical protein A11Q_270 [Pseudobdellovibrio exovorus JSS]
MKNSLAALVVGFVFAIGLGLSGMTQPQKVVGFLDIFGQWDPSLMFVMVGAIAVHGISYRLIRRRAKPFWSSEWHVPTKKEITPSLVLGSFVFGVGWALAGFCPGPAITALATFELRPIIFVVSMLIGMLIFRWLDKVLKIKR